MSVRITLWLALLLVVAYLALWPVPIEPLPWSPPKDNGYIGAFSPNRALAKSVALPLPQSEGPEDLALGPDGALYLSLLDGSILRLDEQGHWQTIANTQGRPLGIEFAPDGTLYIADAHRGLMALPPGGTATVVLDRVAGLPLRYADDLDIAPDGVVYLSDASTRFSAKEYGTFEASLLDLMEHRPSGRLIRFDPASGEASELMTGLSFANGVAVSHDGQSVLVAETGHYRIWRYPLTGESRGQPELLVENLPGFPDNLSRGPHGSYWVGLVAPRNAVLDALAGAPALRRVVQRLPEVLRPNAVRYSHLVGFDDQGQIRYNLQDPAGGYAFITGAQRVGERLYLSSLHEPSLAYLPWPYGDSDTH
ncbi:SMP-30/gluconolactonase/LRE family protein [Ferrimonas balearica]|uniref:SMP-30/gluconolactonase/LRE family protein n=1 Tax=Ferrimonas balearica TaxID=44012 RepID=UPI001C9981CC|nr:SMP-30/gluconolactonase/LRE family protein [Ferrimonas balearica]MBY5991271.1 SMP-30/gluconolactonase/LRE family protein [Ferrimonas balearica]